MIRKTVLIVLFSFGLSLVFCGKQSFAAHTIKASEITKVAEFRLNDASSQGSAVTEKYYLVVGSHDTIVNGNNLAQNIYVYNRNNGSLVKKISANNSWGHGNSLYYKWGSNYVTVLDGGSKKGCIDLNSLNSTNLSHCTSISQKNSIRGIESQGETKYNGYFFSVSDIHGPVGPSYIAIAPYNNRSSILKQYLVPFNLTNPYNEIEDISVDGNTGDVYISMFTWNRYQMAFFKIKHSVFGNYTKPVKQKNANNKDKNGSNNGNSGDKKNNDNNKDKTEKIDKTDKTDKTNKIESSSSASNESNGVIKTAFFGDVDTSDGGCAIVNIAIMIINVLAMLVGPLGVLGIVLFGIQCMTARDDQAQVTKAKKRLFEVVLGLVAFVMLWSFLNWLMPGGVFNNDNGICTGNSVKQEEK